MKICIFTLLAMVVFADPFFEQGTYLKEDKIQKNELYPVAYNAPACIHMERGWDLNVNLSFLYWYMGQTAMDFAYVPPYPAIVTGALIRQNFGYNPGFQVGIGIDTHHDDWTANAEYTWYHNRVSQSAVTPPPFATGYSGWLINNFSPTLAGPYASIGSRWWLQLDQVDLTAGRPFYRGRALTVSSCGGVRALWLSQHEKVTCNNPGVPSDSFSSGSHSWALGVVGNANARIMLTRGLRLDAKMGSSLLYTKYTKLYNRNNNITGVGSTIIGSNFSSATDFNALRPTFDLGLGFGYSTYCLNNKFFFDLAARYDFNIYWAQNMMRNYSSQLTVASTGIGDLFLSGLTLNMRCDF